MDVFWATNCAAAIVAWQCGIASGLYAIVVITIMGATAHAYMPLVQSHRHFKVSTRRRVQWMLWLLPSLLLLFWILSISSFGWSEVGCYVRNFSLGILLWLGPILAAIIFWAARPIGKAGAR
jgi:hypothetical protein